MNKKIIYLFLVIVFLGIIVYLSILFYNRDSNNEKNTATSEINNDVNDVFTLPAKPAVTPEWYLSDKDGDGITDEEEDKIGTNKWESDSDFDGLSDKLEIEQYKTDPMKVDTDGDTYLDGLEVLNNYDPLK